MNIPWRGQLAGVQSRIRLLRSFDQRHHSYLGYVLGIDGVCGDESGEFPIQDSTEGKLPEGPPFLGVPPELETYRSRGHRRLSARTYAAKCASCIWGCKMPVEMIIDHWNPDEKKYRFETFCYGPKRCPLYKAGPTRKVPGHKEMMYEEEDRVDEDATFHRGPDD